MGPSTQPAENARSQLKVHYPHQNFCLWICLINNFRFDFWPHETEDSPEPQLINLAASVPRQLCRLGCEESPAAGDGEWGHQSPIPGHQWGGWWLMDAPGSGAPADSPPGGSGRGRFLCRPQCSAFFRIFRVYCVKLASNSLRLPLARLIGDCCSIAPLERQLAGGFDWNSSL